MRIVETKIAKDAALDVLSTFNNISMKAKMRKQSWELHYILNGYGKSTLGQQFRSHRQGPRSARSLAALAVWTLVSDKSPLQKDHRGLSQKYRGSGTETKVPLVFGVNKRTCKLERTKVSIWCLC